MEVRLPGLLDASLSETARLKPTASSLTLKMKGASEATLTLTEDAPAVAIHDWISLYTQRGFAGIFRVSNAAQNYKKQVDLTLLHGIDILSDSVWAAQTDFSGTKAEFITALLNQQTRLINGVKPWVLGTCADTSAYKKSINYDRLSTLLEELDEDGSPYYFTYDQSSFPWTVSYVAKPSGASSEFRLSRNVQTATVTYNDADLCTRLIVSVNHKTEDSDTGTTSTDSAIRTYNNTEAQSLWGIVVKTADIDTGDDVASQEFAEADAWAQKFLNQRAAPTVQIQIDGEELYYMTGDTWDEFSIGKMCQVALPAYGHSFLERVVSVTYPELLKNPSRVTVSLANTLPRFSENIASAQKAAASAGASARGAARGAASAKELTTWSQHVKYYGEALDGTGVLTLYESGIDMDAAGGVKIFSLVEGVQSLYADFVVNANGITSLVQKTGVNSLGQNETLYSKVTQNAESITSLVTKTGVNSLGQNETLYSQIQQTATDITSLVNKTGVNSLGQNETLYSKVTQNAESITSVVQKTGVNSLGQNETLYSKISQESGRIDLVVSGSGQQASIRIDSIVDGINDSGSSVTINASKIYLNGQAIANSISAVSGEVNDLKTGVTKATLINADSVVADNLAGGTVSGSSVSIGSGTSGGSGTLYYRGSQYYRQGVTLGGTGSIAEGHFLGDSSTTMNLDHYHKIVATEGTGADAGKIIITLTEPVATSDTTNSKTNFNIAATTAYQNGVLAARNAVKVNPFTANAVTGATPDHRTFTYETDAPTPASGTSQEDTWYLAGGTSWSNNKTSVGLHYGSASGTTYALLEVDGPVPSDWQLNYQGNTNYTYKLKAKVGGTWYESGELYAANAYDNGWSGAYGTVGISPSSAQSLAPGGSVTVYAQAKATSGAQIKSNVASVTVSADAISVTDWQLNYDSANYNYKLKAKVNGTWYESGVKTAPNAYDNGWTGAYGTVGISPSAAQTLSAGGSVTIYAQAKATSGAQSKTNVASVTVTADADPHTVQANRTVTYTTNGEKTLNPSDGYNCMTKATITVNVPTETHTVQSNRTVTYSSNGSKTLNPSSGYDVMQKATITVSVPDPDITYPSAATSSSSSGSYDKNYSVSTGYKYHRFKVTAGSKSKTFQITLLAS